MNQYSIIVPIHNEVKSIPNLLNSLDIYIKNGHEVIIIDDGSTDGSTNLLRKNNCIILIKFNRNRGKGFAIQRALEKANHNKIIIFDGDLELNPGEIYKLMILCKNKGINAAMGYRFKTLSPMKSFFNWGNYLFTSFFNILLKSNHRDILCCAKSFYLDQINNYNISSIGFDIDVELSSVLTINNRKKLIPQIYFQYNRRTIKEGKKLKVSDGWAILKKIIKMIQYF